MEPRRPKWSPGDLNGVQEAQMEARRPKWNTRGPLSTQERASARNSDDPPYITPPDKPIQNDSSHGPMLCNAMLKPRRPKWRPGGPN